MILHDERAGTDFTVPPEGARLGRDPALELVFPETDDVVSGLHCRIVRHDDGGWWLEDLGSTNGTWVAGARITAPVRLTTGQRFSLGQRGPVLRVTVPGELARTLQEQALPVADGKPAIRLRRVQGGDDIVAVGREIVIGRSAGCQVALRTVSDSVVSKRHAMITIAEDGAATLADLGSRNGTFLNGNPVHDAVPLKLGDRIMLGWQGPLFELRMLGGQSMPDGVGARHEPQRRPPLTLAGMVAAAGDEAREPGERRVRTGVFVKSMARQIARESSPGFRVALTAGVVMVLGAVGTVWWTSSRRAAEAEARLATAEREFNQRLQHADSVQQAAAADLQTMRREVEDARRNAVSRAVVESLENRLRDAEARAASAGSGAPAAANGSGAVANDFTAVARDNGRAVGLVIVRFPDDSVMGSGFAITTSGYFVTNRHVVQEEGRGTARQVAVVMAETNQILTADVLAVSTTATQDVAILKIRGYRGPAVRAIDWLGQGAQQGAPAVMLGFPFGTSLAVDQGGYVHSSLFGGYISQTGEWIRFSGSTYAGVSGSPVFNAQGQVIAVHFGAPREGPGLGISVPMSKVRRWLPVEARNELGL